MPGSFDLLFGSLPVAPVRKVSTASGGCEACGRRESCNNPLFPIYGLGEKGILIVSDFPSKEDDSDGSPLSGASGRLLRQELRKHGVDFYRDCWTTFAVRCSGPEPKGPQATICRGFLKQEIAKLNPKVIIPLGILATQAALDGRIRGRLTGTKPTAFYGRQIPDQEYKAWVCPAECPKYLQGDRMEDSVMIWGWHLEKALNRPNFLEAQEDDISLCYTAQEAIKAIRRASRWAKATGGEVGFDYETTGIKPHANGHKILCASIAYDNRAFAFPVFEDQEFREEWESFLTDSEVSKLAHNAPFEALWTNEILGYWPEGWAADTCLDAHIIDNNAPTGLKFEVYTRLGIIGYDDVADAYIKSPDGAGCNAFNRMAECPLEPMLTYCAKDSLYMGRIREMQRIDLLEYRPQIKASRFFLESAIELAKCTQHGIRIDMDALESAYGKLEVKISEAMEKFNACPEIKEMGPDFNPGSNHDLGKLLYDKLGYPVGKKRSVDKDVLGKCGYEWAEHLLTARKYEKMRGTYLDGYRKEAVDGKIHGFLPLNRVSSFRGSHSDPNLGNISKRDKEALKILRSLFKPSPGNCIMEIDYSMLEAVIGCCYHQDPTMIMYMENPKADIHSDTATRLYMRDRSFYPDSCPTAKNERSAAKSLVFGSTYGGGAETTHRAVWGALKAETLEHLASKGIRTREQFKAHCEKVHKWMWEEQFKSYGAWRKQMHRDAVATGFFYGKTGFRYRGPSKFTETCNFPTQGSAFHCLLWTLKNTAPLIRGLSWRSNVVCHIHDAIVLDVHPDEALQVAKIINEWATVKVREHWPWITMPLKMEAEISEVDGSWADMKHLNFKDI